VTVKRTITDFIAVEAAHGGGRNVLIVSAVAASVLAVALGMYAGRALAVVCGPLEIHTNSHIEGTVYTDQHSNDIPHTDYPTHEHACAW